MDVYLFALILVCALGRESHAKFEEGNRDAFLPWIESWNRNNTKPWINIDQAYFNIRNDLTERVALLVQNDQCFGCPLEETTGISPGAVGTQLIQTKYASYIQITKAYNSTSSQILCRDHIHLREHGDYWLFVSNTGGNFRCQIVLANNPGNSDLFVLYAFLILVGMAIIWITLLNIWRNNKVQSSLPWNRGKEDYDLQQIQLGSSVSTITTGASANSIVAEKKPPAFEPLPKEKAKAKRVASLDVFRGFSLAAIIFINYGGGQYWYFQHAYWDGLTPADIFMPWFIFMSGTAMPFSYKSFLKKGKSRKMLFLKMLKRSVLLFAVGIVFNRLWDLKRARIMGVLQRIALSYFITAVGHVIFMKEDTDSKKSPVPALADILNYWPEWILNLVYLTVHTALVFALPVPGCPRGYLGPGGMHDGGKYFNCTGGATGYVDRVVLGEQHLYQWPTSKTLYKGVQAFDPEGLLGVLPSAFQCFLGLQVGKIIVYYKDAKGRLIRWIVWMLILCALGTLLCQGKQTGGWIPLNKNLWSLSFTLVLSGLGFGAMVVAYIAVDLTHIWNGAPFIYAGMNSIVIYVGHSFLSRVFPVRWQMESRHAPQLFIALWGVGVWMIVGFVMYLKKVFIAL